MQRLFRDFVAGVCIQVPKNNLNFTVVCQPCYKQYLGGTDSPMPTNTTHLADKYGVYLNPKTAVILSNANAGILRNANGGVIARDGAGLIGNDGSTLVGNDGAS